jgi:hypothetical protein
MHLGALLAVLVSATAFSATPAPPPTGCASMRDEHRQFDFWIGNWEVLNPKGAVAGHSRIEPVSDGCGISEQWQGSGGGGGVSYNAWDSGSGHWRQFWVGNTSGDVLYLVGGFKDGSMSMQGSRPNATDGKPQLQRITWTPKPDGTVRQLWETSDDDGKSWQVSFDGSYHRKKD